MVEYLGKIYKYEEKERLLSKLEREGYMCWDVGGSSYILRVNERVTVDGEGKWFTYIGGGDLGDTTHEFVCVREGQRAIVRRMGREDTDEGYYVWDATFELTTSGLRKLYGFSEFEKYK
jgi:hypothetical protein